MTPALRCVAGRGTVDDDMERAVGEHLLFLSAPAPGHVIAIVPLVRELVARGHRVSYPAAERFHDTLAAAGARPSALPSWHQEGQPAAARTPEVLAAVLDALIDEVERDVPTLLERFAGDRPGAVCYDASTFLGPVLAALWDVPAIALVTTLATGAGFSLFERMYPGAVRHEAMTAPWARLGALLAEHGVTRPVGGLFAPQPEPSNLVFVPRAFQPDGEAFDDRFVFVGPSSQHRADGGDWPAPEPGTRLVLVSLGTTFTDNLPFFRACAEAFAGTDWRVVMALGHLVDRDALGPLPANVDARAHVPQAAVLRRASLFVTHAGLASTMEALSCRVPLLCAPQMAEQEVNAARVEQLGLGRRLPTAPGAAAVRAAADELLADPAVHRNLRDMADRIDTAGGAAAGASVVERALAPRPHACAHAHAPCRPTEECSP